MVKLARRNKVGVNMGPLKLAEPDIPWHAC